MLISFLGGALLLSTATAPQAVNLHDAQPREVSSDGHEIVYVNPNEADTSYAVRGGGVPFGTTPDWSAVIRRQVGGLQIADMNNDGHNDLVVGHYISSSFPPYDDWHNVIYYNTGTGLEAAPSWISTDEVSTGDVQVGDINGDTYLDVFAANGGGAMDPSVIYFGSATGPSTSPGWLSNEPGRAWNNYAVLFDIDHDGDLDVVTANQGNSQQDPYRPMFLFRNNNGTLETVPSWQSAEISIQNFLDFADYNNDGWEELAVSKWSGWQTGIYGNNAGNLTANPLWTTGSTSSDKGIAWADFDGDTQPDFALGTNPTQIWTNQGNGNLLVTWTSGAPFFGHSDLRAFDVDGDGDMDLGEIHFSDGRAHIYINRNGVLDSAPTWTYDASEVGTAMAFGDINGDGRPDLALGYSGNTSIRVFYAVAPPCPEDLDGSGTIGLGDLGVLFASYGGPGTPAQGDLDGDGQIGLSDLGLLLAAYGNACP